MTNKKPKKASAAIIKALLKIEPKLSKNTNYVQAFDILMDEWNMSGDISDTKEHLTTFTLYRNDEIVAEFQWKDIWEENEGDWDYNILYKDILETSLKKKLYKEPKKKKANPEIPVFKMFTEEPIIEEPKATKKTKAKKTVTVTVKKEPEEPKELTKDDLKKQKANLYQRIKNWRKKGKDPRELVEQYNKICEQLK